MSAELTDPAYSIGTRVQDRVWRGRPYSDEIEPLLVKLGHGVGDDVKDWQLAYVGYSPSRDTFVVVFDLYLSEGTNEDGEPLMACSSVTCRLEPRKSGVRVTPGRHERLGPGFYGKEEDAVRARFPDLLEVHLE